MANEQTPTEQAPNPAPSQENVSASEAASQNNSSPATETTKTESAPSEVESTVLGAEDAAEKSAETPAANPSEVKTETTPSEAKPEGDGAEKKTEEAKPEEKKDDKPADGDKKPEEKAPETKTEDKAPELPKLEFKFPEGATVDDTRIQEFSKELGEFAISNKIEAKLVQEFGQKLVDRHVAEVQAVAQKVADAYNKVWNDQTKGWYDEFVKDPEIGGNRKDTTINAAREFIRRHGGTPEQQKEIRTLMQKTGIGNHPALIRLFSKANVSMREPKVVKAESPPATSLSMKQKMYGSRKKS